MNYIIEQTQSFAKWHRELRDLRAKVAIARRIIRAEKGNLGDIKSVGECVSELRIDVGTGLPRLFYAARWPVCITASWRR